MDEFSQLKNVTESRAIEYAFKKSFDILLDKQGLEQANFTMVIANMELLVFEMFLDSLTIFLRNFKNEIGTGSVNVMLKHQPDYEQKELDKRRWEKAWNYLKNELVEMYQDIFYLKIKNFVPTSHVRVM